MKYLLFLLLSVIPVTLFAQAFTVSADRMNLVYIGMDNPVTIISGSCNCKDLSASVDIGTLKKVEGCKFLYTADKPGVVTLTVQQKTAEGLRVIGTQKLRAKLIGDAKATIGNKAGGYYPLHLFKAQKGISVTTAYFEPEITAKVVRFEFKVFRKKSMIIFEEVSGTLFNSECQRLITQLLPGDIVRIEKIRVVRADNREISLSDMVFTMK